ncbi:small subunit ribosomal protein S11 [Vigna unguiculata]|uniref:Small subunit ribosomal protein S11 n=1 Tax=Vigna unguiculata TaxID=3917 RepID=A0A4D6MU83_VIGUN|nr:small subunit ribosomal protein S11 [Vigna unguiculata]
MHYGNAQWKRSNPLIYNEHLLLSGRGGASKAPTKQLPLDGYVRGWVISCSSTSTCGFKGIRRETPFAAQTITGNVIRIISDQGMQQAEIMINGPDLGRDVALRVIRRISILLIRDVTPMPHNGCR